MRKGSQVSLLLVAVAVATVARTRAQKSSAIQDVSPPRVSFECGRRSPTIITYPSGSEPEIIFGPLLRPGHNRTAPRPTRRPPRPVVDGITVEINAWPWMALLGEKVAGEMHWHCGGSLINEQWILTALHCFFFKNFNVVRLGEHDYENDFDGANPVDVGIAETILYPGYVHPQAYHDLALLKLDTKVTIQEGIRPVCLPWGKESNVDLTGKKVTLTGWGDTSYSQFHLFLRAGQRERDSDSSSDSCFSCLHVLTLPPSLTQHTGQHET
ncbi:venom protease-like isoform X2 [Panulirus ornatus]|uniref:venom protease-like isoform X2 n=1 Tax=Panulirus ornatus TaxID=150431 RepID=UPI003A85B8C9